jgi:hypothetical protein
MVLIKQFGLHWPRNQENLEEIEDVAGHKSGIYVLYHGAMPVYMGAERSAPGCEAIPRKVRRRISFGTDFRGL